MDLFQEIASAVRGFAHPISSMHDKSEAVTILTIRDNDTQSEQIGRHGSTYNRRTEPPPRGIPMSPDCGPHRFTRCENVAPPRLHQATVQRNTSAAPTATVHRQGPSLPPSRQRPTRHPPQQKPSGVDALVAMGFSRKVALEAWHMARGDMNAAVEAAIGSAATKGDVTETSAVSATINDNASPLHETSLDEAESPPSRPSSWSYAGAVAAREARRPRSLSATCKGVLLVTSQEEGMGSGAIQEGQAPKPPAAQRGASSSIGRAGVERQRGASQSAGDFWTPCVQRDVSSYSWLSQQRPATASDLPSATPPKSTPATQASPPISLTEEESPRLTSPVKYRHPPDASSATPWPPPSFNAPSVDMASPTVPLLAPIPLLDTPTSPAVPLLPEPHAATQFHTPTKASRGMPMTPLEVIPGLQTPTNRRFDSLQSSPMDNASPQVQTPNSREPTAPPAESTGRAERRRTRGSPQKAGPAAERGADAAVAKRECPGADDEGRGKDGGSSSTTGDAAAAAALYSDGSRGCDTAPGIRQQQKDEVAVGSPTSQVDTRPSIGHTASSSARTAAVVAAAVREAVVAAALAHSGSSDPPRPAIQWKGHPHEGLGLQVIKQEGVGIIIFATRPGGAAFMAEPYLRVGDRIISINGQPTRTVADVTRDAAGPAGTSVLLHCSRTSLANSRFVLLISLVRSRPGAHTVRLYARSKRDQGMEADETTFPVLESARGVAGASMDRAEGLMATPEKLGWQKASPSEARQGDLTRWKRAPAGGIKGLQDVSSPSHSPGSSPGSDGEEGTTASSPTTSTDSIVGGTVAALGPDMRAPSLVEELAAEKGTRSAEPPARPARRGNDGAKGEATRGCDANQLVALGKEFVYFTPRMMAVSSPNITEQDLRMVVAMGGEVASLTKEEVVSCTKRETPEKLETAAEAGVVNSSELQETRVFLSAAREHDRVPHEELDLMWPPMGTGSCKTVYQAYWRGSVVAAAHIRKGDAKKELGFLRRLKEQLPNHPHVPTFHGVSKDTQGCTWFVTEFFPLGGLDTQLEVWEGRLSVEVKVCISLQILSCLSSLQDLGIVHRDIASRNVLVHSLHANRVSDVWVKVTDFGSAVQAGQGSTVGLEEDVPWRWVSPEVHEEGLWGEGSDVWAYGVTVWEIFSDAKIPYCHISDDAVLREAVFGQGLRLGQPSSCPDWIYAFMHECWELEWKRRTGFRSLEARLNAAAIANFGQFTSTPRQDVEDGEVTYLL